MNSNAIAYIRFPPINTVVSVSDWKANARPFYSPKSLCPMIRKDFFDSIDQKRTIPIQTLASQRNAHEDVRRWRRRWQSWREYGPQPWKLLTRTAGLQTHCRSFCSTAIPTILEPSTRSCRSSPAPVTARSFLIYEVSVPPASCPRTSPDPENKQLWAKTCWTYLTPCSFGMLFSLASIGAVERLELLRRFGPSAFAGWLPAPAIKSRISVNQRSPSTPNRSAGFGISTISKLNEVAGA